MDRETMRWVDMTPDEGLARRILEAYIDDAVFSGTDAAGDESPVVAAMNEHRLERNRILRSALGKLG